jgi:ABC-type antimicrobial peptide transport system permease subunit
MKINKGDNIPTVLVNDGSRGLNPNMWEFAQPLHVLSALTGLVLLLACANIANLMLARATAREREMSVRLALGASRTRVLRQILTESLLLSTLGGTLGLLLAFLGRNLLPGLIELPWHTDRTVVAFDWHVFGFAAAITITTGLLFGLLPAWRSSQGDLNRPLKEAGRSATRRRYVWTGKQTLPGPPFSRAY